MKVVAIIQARMGSTRLPGKMLMDIGGKPAIQHVVERARKAARVNMVVLATTSESADDALAVWAEKNSVPCFRGSEDDVLDRYYQCAKAQEADVVVRITGDCPLLDPEALDQVIAAYIEGDCDYASNTHPPTYPDGLDCEAFSFAALERAWREARLASEREHVTPYVWKHPEMFRIKNVTSNEDLSNHRWTLDTPEDLIFIRHILTACSVQGDCSLLGVLAVLAQHPEWKAINAQFERNEGYIKSLQNDQPI